jgi:hypothetical protein
MHPVPRQRGQVMPMHGAFAAEHLELLAHIRNPLPGHP